VPDYPGNTTQQTAWSNLRARYSTFTGTCLDETNCQPRMKVVESRVANLLLYGSELIGSMRLVFMDGYLPIYFYRAVVDVILTAQRR